MEPPSPSKIVTITYTRRAFEDLPPFLQRHARSKENWELIQQECERRGARQEEDFNSRAGLLSLQEIERRERPRYGDRESALRAMRQFLKDKPDLPIAGRGEGSQGRWSVGPRKEGVVRRRGTLAEVMLVGDEGEERGSEVVAGVESVLGRGGDAEGGAQDGKAKVAGAEGKGKKVPDAVSGTKAYEEEEWVIIPTAIVGSKSQDDGPSPVESESDFEYDNGSGEDEDGEEEDNE